MNRAAHNADEGILSRSVAAEADRSRLAYRALLEHAGKCVACNQGDDCPAGAQLRHAWREARR